MKRLLLLLGLSFISFSLVFAQEVPPNVQYSFSVVNVSKENQNAETVGAQPGDVLRYEMLFECGEEGMSGILPTVDVTQIIKAGDVIDLGTGVLSGNTLTFPEINETGNCNKSLTFFVRIKEDCGDSDHIQTNSLGKLLNVPLTCDLSSTGPLFEGMALFALIFGSLLFFILIGRRRLRGSH